MADVCNFGFLGRKNHFALEWEGRIMIWGGWSEEERPCIPSHVQVLYDGKWRCMKTTGRNFVAESKIVEWDNLVLLNPRTAHVVGDKVYVMATRELNQ